MVELVVDLGAIRANTQAVARLLGGQGLRLVAVTKGCLGEPRVAQAMLEGGAAGLADTRDANLRRLRAALPAAELHRIYLPPPTGRFQPGDLTYLSNAEGAAALASRGSAQRPQRAMLMLESGDRREGVPLVDLDDLVACVLAMPELELAGVATNFACFAGTCGGLRDSVETLAEAVRGLRSRGLTVARVSGGNSSLLALLRGGEALPGEITEIRCGEALLLGRDALEYAPLPDCRQDACLLRAQVLESYTKAAAEGPLRRLVLGLGSQDLGAGGLRFRQEGLFEAGRSADYLVVGVEAGGPSIEVGEVLEIIPSYYALSAAWTSPFVEVRFV